MRFGFHLYMVDPAEFLDIARTADEWGWDSIQVADAPFFPEVTSAPYPYTADGVRFWPLDLPVLDPWVAITAMATVTKGTASFTGLGCSEPRLIEIAYAFEQATKKRVPPLPGR